MHSKHLQLDHALYAALIEAKITFSCRRPDKLRVIWLRSHRKVKSNDVSLYSHGLWKNHILLSSLLLAGWMCVTYVCVFQYDLALGCNIITGQMEMHVYTKR